MITVRLMGGLGNQLFQWAYGKSLSLFDEVQYDRSRLDRGSRRYRLDSVGLNLRFGDITKHDVILGESSFNDLKLAPWRGIGVDGYWQSEKFFERVKEEIRAEMFRGMKASHETIQLTKELIKVPWNHQTTFVHVRRTDYLNLQDFHGLMGLDYYEKAMAEINGPKTFYIFSDDPTWCKYQAVLNNNSTVIVDFNQDRENEDLWLMSRCRSAITANSSFSWWGAWLQEPHESLRKVIAPKKWFTHLKSDDIIPEGWIKI